jgi:hypothetical protein
MSIINIAGGYDRHTVVIVQKQSEKQEFIMVKIGEEF